MDLGQGPRRGASRGDASGEGEEADGALVLAVRLRDERAARRFVELYKPLLMDTAAKFRIAVEEREDVVLRFLADQIVELILSMEDPPRRLAGYLITTFTNQLLREAAVGRRERQLLEVIADRAETAEPVIRQSTSEAAQRDSEGWGEREQALPEVLQRLVRAMEEGLSLESRMLLTFMAKDHPHARIAEWLGIEVKAASKRIERLYWQCFYKAVDFANALPHVQRKELRGYFDRWAVTYGIEGPDDQIVNARPSPRSRR